MATIEKFTHAAQEALQAGQSAANTAGHAEYSPLHLLSALTADARGPAGGVLERLLAFAQAVVGRFPGGLAYVNVVSNLIFSGMSGSAVADAAGPGLVVARMMVKGGRYPAGFAAATSAVSATLGPLVPPSIPMIFYALIANASVGALFLAGVAPALLTAFILCVAIAYIARRRGFPVETPPPWAQIPRIVLRALPPLALPGILLGIIYSGVATPTEAAALAATYALILAGIVYRSVSLAELRRVVSDTVRQTAAIGMIRCGAFVFNYAVANEGVPNAIRDSFIAWQLSPVAFLLSVTNTTNTNTQTMHRTRTKSGGGYS
jgi:tripartite ATP-independent transporter DctM subunit